MLLTGRFIPGLFPLEARTLSYQTLSDALSPDSFLPDLGSFNHAKTRLVNFFKQVLRMIVALCL